MERNKDGTIKKGIVLNPKGRPKGTPNKTTSELKEVIKTIIDDELEKINEHLEQIEPKERLDFIVKLLPYVVPKQYDHTTKGKEINDKEINRLIIALPNGKEITDFSID